MLYTCLSKLSTAFPRGILFKPMVGGGGEGISFLSLQWPTNVFSLDVRQFCTWKIYGQTLGREIPLKSRR